MFNVRSMLRLRAQCLGDQCQGTECLGDSVPSGDSVPYSAKLVKCKVDAAPEGPVPR